VSKALTVMPAEPAGMLLDATTFRADMLLRLQRRGNVCLRMGSAKASQLAMNLCLDPRLAR